MLKNKLCLRKERKHHINTNKNHPSFSRAVRAENNLIHVSIIFIRQNPRSLHCDNSQLCSVPPVGAVVNT
ncbi:hypothetical protein EOY42_26200 [Salmonella enterica]|nr:hypothetical protein [Salmonella enterica]